MDNPIFTFIILVITGIIILLIGLSNIRGNLSAIHAYHTNNIKPEDKPIFGKIVGIGHIIIGICIIIKGILSFMATYKNIAVFSQIGNAVLISGTVIGLVIIFYALFKYNKKSK